MTSLSSLMIWTLTLPQNRTFLKSRSFLNRVNDRLRKMIVSRTFQITRSANRSKSTKCSNTGRGGQHAIASVGRVFRNSKIGQVAAKVGL